jgi:regulator of PEP synthase PpsR (kinase-PPPase family)
MAKYEIKDLEEFTENARRLVFSSFGKAVEETPDDFTDMITKLSGEEETEMNQVLSQQESMLIVESLTRKQTNKTTKQIRYIVNEKMFTDILEALNARLVSNILSNLNKRGLIESAYDDTLNDFVFWVKEEDNNEKNNTK